jgi:transposase InsO family protein
VATIMGKVQLDELSKLYRDPKFPGSFGGVRKFLNAVKENGLNISDDNVKKWMRDEDLYQLHKPSRKTFPRRPIIVQGIDHLWQADLSDVSSLKTHNYGNRFLLFVIDAFSKYAWVTPLKDKTASSLTIAMKDILKKSQRIPLHLQTDKGSEFVNAQMKQLMKDNGINFYTSQNEETKAAFVERLQRTFKTKMFRFFTDRNTLRYMDVLQDLMDSYNNTLHSTTGMKPADVTKKNEGVVRSRLCKIWSRPLTKKSPPLTKGDKVRLSVARHTFRKGYLPQWTEEIFTVNKVLSTKPTTYKVEDYNGEVLKGSFYLAELQQVPDKPDRVYRIEKVLKTRKVRGRKEYFVKWQGYPKDFNSWVKEVDMV